MMNSAVTVVNFIWLFILFNKVREFTTDPLSLHNSCIKKYNPSIHHIQIDEMGRD